MAAVGILGFEFSPTTTHHHHMPKGFVINLIQEAVRSHRGIIMIACDVETAAITCGC
jgi:hypothetical protein